MSQYMHLDRWVSGFSHVVVVAEAFIHSDTMIKMVLFFEINAITCLS